MFLLIFESIGTSELILIAIVALIVFGPRKLPDLAKTLGKTMSEFRNATNEFKSTWEREVAFEDDTNKNTNGSLLTDTVVAGTANSTEISSTPENANLLEPKIKELSSEEAEKLFKNKQETMETPQTENYTVQTKRDWL